MPPKHQPTPQRTTTRSLDPVTQFFLTSRQRTAATTTNQQGREGASGGMYFTRGVKQTHSHGLVVVGYYSVLASTLTNSNSGGRPPHRGSKSVLLTGDWHPARTRKRSRHGTRGTGRERIQYWLELYTHHKISPTSTPHTPQRLVQP